jgi:hypothetical protein
MAKESVIVQELEPEHDAKVHLLWKCNAPNCGAFHIRTTRMNKANKTWFQSPCPKCGVRTRLNEGNTKAFSSKQDAEYARDLICGRWL